MNKIKRFRNWLNKVNPSAISKHIADDITLLLQDSRKEWVNAREIYS